MASEVTITVRPDGPYRVQGLFKLVDADGNSFELPGETVFLCRCGGSGNKPFCDGTHKRIGFQAPTRAVKEAAGQPG